MTSRLLLSAAVLAVQPASAQGPIPPALVPPGLEQPVDGYDMSAIYQRWRDWVEREKGPVIEEASRGYVPADGLSAFGVLLRFARYNDFGLFVSGEVVARCRPSAQDRFVPLSGSCIYYLSRSYVPLDAATYGAPNALSEWTAANFNATSIAARLRAAGYPPNTDWWRTDLKPIFAAGPSPRAILRANAVTVRVNSRDCAGFGRAIAEAEGEALTARVDMSGVGTDAPVMAPRPHAIIRVVTLFLRTGGGMTTIEDADGIADRVAAPILEAASACDAARR